MLAETVELKREYVDDIKKTVVAFANSEGGDSYEAARSLNQQLTFTWTSAFFKKRGQKFGTQQMRTLHFVGEDGTYTNLAFLLSEQCTHTIKLAVFEGSKKTVFKDRTELSGSLLEQLESAFNYIDRYNRTRAEFQGLDRLEFRDYPVEAVREALLNAIVHRDYSFSGPILISIFEDRMEFVSIGGLIKGISLDDITLGVSVLRNQYLAAVFYRLKLIEAYGTGILKINECYTDSAVKPSIVTASNSFKIILPNINYEKENHDGKEEIKKYEYNLMVSLKKDERVNAIVALCQKKGFVVRKDIESALHVSQSTAILLLRRMTAEGILVKRGAARNLRYYLLNK